MTGNRGKTFSRSQDGSQENSLVSHFDFKNENEQLKASKEKMERGHLLSLLKYKDSQLSKQVYRQGTKNNLQKKREQRDYMGDIKKGRRSHHS